MIDISKLIDAAQELVHNGDMGGAAKGTMPVQVLEIDGKEYQLSVTMELK